MGICQASYINPHEMNMSMLNNFNRSNMLKNIQHKYPEENITFKNGNLNNNNQFSMNNNFGNFNNIGNMNYNFGNIKNNFAFDYNTNSNIENLNNKQNSNYNMGNMNNMGNMYNNWGNMYNNMGYLYYNIPNMNSNIEGNINSIKSSNNNNFEDVKSERGNINNDKKNNKFEINIDSSLNTNKDLFNNNIINNDFNIIKKNENDLVQNINTNNINKNQFSDNLEKSNIVYMHKNIKVNNDSNHINLSKLKDKMCILHGIQKPYNKYCKTCQKNICSWCIQHENHQLINLNSLESSVEKYNESIENLKKMKEIKEEINNIFLEKMNKYNKINNKISELSSTIESFEKLIKYNETIIKAYGNNIYNYYVLDSFQKLNFILDKKELIKELDDELEFNFKEANKNQKKNLISQKNDNFIILNNFTNFEQLNKLKLNQANGCTEYINMLISEKYCKNWGLNEGIREFLQNQYDGIITAIKTKKNLKIIKIGNKEEMKGTKVYLNFDFINIIDNKLIGKIRYYENEKILKISNDGVLWLGDFLLGSSKSEKNNNELIGTFGEGMKIAILALCRLNKNITIISSDKEYNFLIKEDNIFLINNQPQKSLHLRYKKLKHSEEADKVIIIINNIDKNEWGNQIINYLWLLDDDAKIYVSYDKDNREIGYILAEDYLRSKVYVKGIFVQCIKNQNNNKLLDCPGFNIDIKLDRDRNYILNNYEFQNIVTDIISNFFNQKVIFILNAEKEIEITKMKKKEEEERKKKELEVKKKKKKEEEEKKKKKKEEWEKKKKKKKRDEKGKEKEKERIGLKNKKESEEKKNKELEVKKINGEEVKKINGEEVKKNNGEKERKNKESEEKKSNGEEEKKINGEVEKINKEEEEKINKGEEKKKKEEVEIKKLNNLKNDNINAYDYQNVLIDIINSIGNENLNFISSYDLANNLSQESIEYIWNKVYLTIDKEKSPVTNESEIQNFIREKNLPKNFYPYLKVNYDLMQILERSKNYISISDKFDGYIANSIEVKPKGKYLIALGEIYSKIKKLEPSFNENKVRFIKFGINDKNFCYLGNNIINFSSLKLEEEIDNTWKFWIFIKIAKILDINIEENYYIIKNGF